MILKQLPLEKCDLATGLVVVIDVCRAFTTSAFTLAAGAQRILLVGTVEEALSLRQELPGSLVMGEVNGLPVPGFDLWNSPSAIQKKGIDLFGKTVIQRTSSGTQGVVRSVNGIAWLAASFVVASATLRLIRKLAIDEVAFIITGSQAATGAAEDVTLAKFLIDRLEGKQVNPENYLDWHPKWDPRRVTQDPNLLTELNADLACCQMVDFFDFGMQVHQEGKLWVMEPIR